MYDACMDQTQRRFTAWLTTDPIGLTTPYADVVVLQDELEADDPNAWASTGDPVFTANTTINAATGDPEDMERQAVELLTAAGWVIEGKWEGYTTGGYVRVRPTCKTCGDDLGEMYAAGYCGDSCARDGWSKQAKQEQAETEKVATITPAPSLGGAEFYRIDYAPSGTRSVARATDLTDWIADLTKAGYRIVRP